MAKKPNDVPGLSLRLKAAERLQVVLKGASFSPFGASELADSRDRAVANRLVTTALRYHGPISKLVDRLLERGMPKKSGRFEAILHLSLAQLLFLPDLGDHSALFLAGEALRADVRTQHLIRLMNGVLREAQRRRHEVEINAGTLFPSGLLKIWQRAYGGPAVEAFGAALIEGAPLDITLKADAPAMVESLGGRVLLADTVRIDSRDRPVDQLHGYAEGRFWVQDAAAAIPARLLKLKAGARVLDIGAAPGGKTAQLVKAGYAVTALDRDPSRIERLRDNLKRLNYAADIVTADVLDYGTATPFDGVLLDAPCSATGTFRRHPEVVWHRNAADIQSRVSIQRLLIERAVLCLNPGGVLLYCVCSLEPQEGESQAAWALSQGLEVMPVTPEELDGWAAPVTKDGFVRTHPGLTIPEETGGTLDGFFIARFRRR